MLRMNRVRTIVICLVCGVAALKPSQGLTQPAPGAVIAEAVDLTIVDVHGGPLRIQSPSPHHFTVLCFLGTECPLARLYGPRLQRLAQRYSERVSFVGICSNQQDSLRKFRHYGQQHGIGFPLGMDYDQEAMRRFHVTRTPEVIVIDSQGRVRYQGRIDDQYLPGVARPEPTTADLRAALDALLVGQEVTIAKTNAVGCLIAPKREPDPDATVTFANQVSRVLNQQCVQCHREGEIGPLGLTDYDQVIGWADMILEVVDDGRMPPWHAAEGDVELENARKMTADQRQLLHDWVAAGTPFGDPADLPTAVMAATDWHLPQSPDLVVPMREKPFIVPAEGTVDYQYFVVDPGFESEQWVSAAEVIPGNRGVVHHCIVFLRPPDGTRMQEIGFLSAYVPGQEATIMPAGYGRRIPAGSQFVFQMHYTPNGTPQSDISKIGLVFAPADSITHEVLVLGGIEQDFEIPPHDSSHTVTGDVGHFPRDAELMAIAPHMHVRGKSFELIAEQAERTRTLLRVPRYDFNWQHNYRLAQPLPLADIQRIQFRCTFDNSSKNPSNPDPTQYVTWGDQTWEEMSLVFLQIARPLQRENTADQDDQQQRERQEMERQRRQADAEQFADQFIRRFDRDGDGQVSKTEVPTAFYLFQFRNVDQDKDGLLTREELIKAALARQ